MKILKIKVDGLKLFPKTLEIDFLAQQRVRGEDNDALYCITPKMYQNNALAFIGINASGKTLTLKVISFVIQMLNNRSINNTEGFEIFSGVTEGNQILFETYFCDKSEMVYRLTTTIRRMQESNETGGEYYIAKEELWGKDVASILTKKSIFDFSKSELIKNRQGDEAYLPEDVSIIIALNKKNDSKIYYQDLIVWTNYNLPRIVGDMPKELISFLDPSIEYLTAKFEEGPGGFDIRLKFKGKDEMILHAPMDLERYLSSGTIKGMNIFINAMDILGRGGYLIIDELENHFNKEIAATLVRFFMDSKVNKKGAVIIFSTHYPEILDEFERNDAINIIRNIGGIEVENLSNILTRNDMKKSEVYQSGYLQGTAPAYEAYINLKRAIVDGTDSVDSEVSIWI